MLREAATNRRTTGDKTMDGMDGTGGPPASPPAAAFGGGRSDHHLDRATGGLARYAGDEAGGAGEPAGAGSEPTREPSAQDEHGRQTAGGRSSSSTKRRQTFAFRTAVSFWG